MAIEPDIPAPQPAASAPEDASSAASEARRKARASRAARVALAVAGVLWLVWAAENWVGERVPAIGALTYVPQHGFLLLPLALLGVALWRHEWRAAGLNALAAGFWLVWGMGFVVPLHGPVRATPGRVQVRAMSFNMLGGLWSVERVSALVRREQPDVVCFQEARAYSPTDPMTSLRAELPGYFKVRAGEVATFSRFPILQQRAVPMPDGVGRQLLVTDLDVRGQRVRVINIHLTGMQIRNWRAGLRGEWGSRVMHTAHLRDHQVDALEREANAAPGLPLLIMGDFNTPPRGQLYRRLASRWQDGFRATGWGLGHSYSSKWPLVRIDYAWTNARFRVLKCGPLAPFARDCNGQMGLASDHRALVCELEVVP